MRERNTGFPQRHRFVDAALMSAATMHVDEITPVWKKKRIQGMRFQMRMQGTHEDNRAEFVVISGSFILLISLK